LAVLHAFAKPADLECTEVGGTVGGVASIEGQLVNSWVPDSDLFTAAFHRSGVYGLHAHGWCWSSKKNPRSCNQTCSATTSRLLFNGRVLKM